MQDRAKWLGRLISALTALIMIADGITGLFWPRVVAAEMAGDGWPPETLVPVAVLALTGGLLYAIPRTAFLGAIVITGFVGGALAVHLRVTLAIIWPEIVNISIGVAAWAGLYLRDPRLRALLIRDCAPCYWAVVDDKRDGDRGQQRPVSGPMRSAANGDNWAKADVLLHTSPALRGRGRGPRSGRVRVLFFIQPKKKTKKKALT